MIRYIRHRDIDRSKWDHCITSSPNKLVYALTWYLDAVSPQWDALVEDDYTAVMPLTWKRKFGFYYLVQPPFCQQLGVFSQQGNQIDVTPFLDEIPRKFIRLRICLNSSNYISDKKYSCEEKVNLEISLNQSYNDIFESFSKSHKKNIRRANNIDLEIIDTDDTREIIRLFQGSHQVTFTLPGFYYSFLAEIEKSTLYNKAAKVLVAKSPEHGVVAGLLLLKVLDRYILLLSPTNKEGKRIRAIFSLFDYFFSSYSGVKRIFDFEGSNISGVARFFKGFGAINKPYLYLRYSRFPFL